MANIKSAIKRIKVTRRNNLQNKLYSQILKPSLRNTTKR